MCPHIGIWVPCAVDNHVLSVARSVVVPDCEGRILIACVGADVIGSFVGV